MAEHKLKTWPSYFEAIRTKKKTFEVRVHDRDFAVDHKLVLREYDPERNQYSGRTVTVKVTYFMPGGKFGIDPAYCVMGFKFVGENLDR